MTGTTEKQLLKQTYKLGVEAHQTHIKLPFILEENFDYLKIIFSFGPQIVAPEEAKAYIQEAMSMFFTPKEQEAMHWSDFLPLVNLLTISVKQKNQYLGCYHHKACNQEIILAADRSSRGFDKVNLSQGQGPWEIQISAHCMLSHQGFAEIIVYGGMKNEVL